MKMTKVMSFHINPNTIPSRAPIPRGYVIHRIKKNEPFRKRKHKNVTYDRS